MWRLIYSPFLWLLALPVKVIVGLLGFIVIPIAAACKAYEITEYRPPGHPKHYDGHKYNWTWDWMRPWDNHTDGIANRNYKQFDSMFWQIMYWSAWRNAANGLRVTPYYSFVIDKDKVGFVGSLPYGEFSNYKGRFPHWYFAWHGIYTCFFWQFYLYPGHLRRFWIGWKLKPQDNLGVPEDDYRKEGATFTVQFKRIHVR